MLNRLVWQENTALLDQRHAWTVLRENLVEQEQRRPRTVMLAITPWVGPLPAPLVPSAQCVLLKTRVRLYVRRDITRHPQVIRNPCHVVIIRL